nr:MAG TPA: hypothetical protein [Caudoviricetes sp.]
MKRVEGDENDGENLAVYQGRKIMMGVAGSILFSRSA